MAHDGRLGHSPGLPLRLGTFDPGTTSPQGYGQAQAKIVTFGVNGFGQAQARIGTVLTYGQAQAYILAGHGHGQAQADILQTYPIPNNSTSNTTSPTGNVLVVTGTTETILPGTDLTMPSHGYIPIKLTWNVWISHNHVQVVKQEIIRLRRDNASGAVLDSFTTSTFPNDSGDSTSGHQFQWSSSFVDSSPTTGHYVLTVQEIGVNQPSTTEIYSDTRTFTLDVAAGPFGQTQAKIKVFGVNAFGQAQAKINAFGVNGFGQAQALVGRGLKLGQAQAKINSFDYPQFGQAQADIKATTNKFGQAKADILATSYGLGQSQTTIATRYFQAAQAQAFIIPTRNFGQAQAQMLAFNVNKFGQAKADILVTTYKFGQANADIKATSNGFGQARALVVIVYQQYGQAQGKINSFGVKGFGQSQAQMLAFNVVKRGNVRAYIKTEGVQRYGQARAKIGNKQWQWSQAQADIKKTTRVFGQANADILKTQFKFGQARAWIEQTYNGYGQAQARVRGYGWGQAQAQIFGVNTRRFGQAQAQLISTPNRFGQAQALMDSTRAYGQAMACIVGWGFGQARARILAVGYGFGQASFLTESNRAFGQANADILVIKRKYGQAIADILQTYTKSGNARADIKVTGNNRHGQARASIAYRSFPHAQAAALIVRSAGPGTGGPPPTYPAQEYIVVYNDMQLPGYAQSEEMNTTKSLTDLTSFDFDGNLHEQSYLQNQTLRMEFLILGSSWRESKDFYHLTQTALSTARGYKRLYIDYLDRYLLAEVQNVSYQKEATLGNKFLPYSVVFQTQPWLISKTTNEVSGSSGLITVSRTIDDGTWTPTEVEITGTNVTISGYTDTEFTGYISVDGNVNGLVIDTESMTATMDGDSAESLMLWKDYSLYIGTGTTYFEVDGASSIVIRYKNRWL